MKGWNRTFLLRNAHVLGANCYLSFREAYLDVFSCLKPSKLQQLSGALYSFRTGSKETQRNEPKNHWQNSPLMSSASWRLGVWSQLKEECQSMGKLMSNYKPSDNVNRFVATRCCVSHSNLGQNGTRQIDRNKHIQTQQGPSGLVCWPSNEGSKRPPACDFLPPFPAPLRR